MDYSRYYEKNIGWWGENCREIREMHKNLTILCRLIGKVDFARLQDLISCPDLNADKPPPTKSVVEHRKQSYQGMKIGVRQPLGKRIFWTKNSNSAAENTSEQLCPINNIFHSWSSVEQCNHLRKNRPKYVNKYLLCYLIQENPCPIITNLENF